MYRLQCGHLDPLYTRNYLKLGCLLAAGAFFLIAGIVVARNPIMLAINGRVTPGTVTENKEEEVFKNGEQKIAISSGIQYSDETGRSRMYWTRRQHPIGSTVDMVYLPDEPDVASISGDKSGFGGPALPVFIGLVVLSWAGWKTRSLLIRRKPLKELLARVVPIDAEVISVRTESYRSHKRGSRTHRNYTVVAQANIPRQKGQEFESYNYQGWSPVEKGHTIKLYVDPMDPSLYYLCAKP